jgi:AcrR family transcriptional regulator
MPSVQSRISAKHRRQQIMRVAARLFARRGYSGTTTRQIAERAGVSEAIIFRHFSNKDELYQAILEAECGKRSPAAVLKRTAGSARDDFELLAAVAEEILSWDALVGRLLLFSALESDRLSHRRFLAHMAPYQELLCGLVHARMGEGRFRGVDPLVAAQGFFGMLVYHFQVRGVYGKRLPKHERRQLSEALASLWLEGMETREVADRVPQQEILPLSLENEDSHRLAYVNGGENANGFPASGHGRRNGHR